MRALLTIEAGQGDPRVCPLEAERPVTLGRHHKNVIVLHDEHASRWHAEVFHLDGRWFIRDAGTLNGTRVNGTPVGQPAGLENGQVIGIGRTLLRFSVEAAANGHVPARGGGHFAPSPLEIDQTVLCQDELTVLCHFMGASVRETDARALIHKALETVHGQVGAAVSGFLSLDRDALFPKVVLPKLARVDIELSRQLTTAVQHHGRLVWLGGQPNTVAESDSLLSYTDALCVPLYAGETPLGALHVYKAGRLFTEREARFCEVLAGHLANSLRVLRVQRSLEAENSRLRSHAPAADELIGDSPPLRDLRQRITKLAWGKSTVLIVGESGVGKELVALALHRQSPRREGPLVTVNCAAIAPSLLESELFGHCKGAFSGADRDRSGLFQQADEGTLFLDEVGELSPECQAKLLRVIEGKGFRPVGADTEVQVCVRIVAATHRDLQAEVEAGKFRRDLFFRLQGLRIPVPPLREHLEDIPDLADYFLDRLCVEWNRAVQLSPAALARLQEYSWPGNVRQLRSVLDNAVALSDGGTLQPEDLALPAGPCADRPVILDLEKLEAWAIRQALHRTKGNVSQASQLLGIVRDTLANKLKKYGINKDEV